MFISNFTLSILVAFVMSLLFESPILVLEKMLVDVEKATIRPTDEEIKPTIKPVLQPPSAPTKNAMKKF